jgi:2,3-dihydroxybenzoate decarboxylase
MRVIALEEAFSMEGLKMVPKTNDWPIPIDPQIMETWGTRLHDFEEWRLPDMDAHGVTVQVLSLTAPGIQAVPDVATALANARLANDYLAALISKHPDRFRGFAALPLQDPEAAAQELNRCVRELGFCGALVNDHTLGNYLDAPQFSVVWQALTDAQVPLYIHPGAPPLDRWNVLNGYPELTAASWAWQAQVGGHAMRLIHGGVFDRFPTAKVILGHMGEFLPFQIWRFDSRYKTLKNQNLERLPSEYFGRNIFITTSGVFSPAALAGAILAIGEDSVLFAIDYPYESTEEAVRFLNAAPLSGIAREKIAGLNAERLLGIQSHLTDKRQDASRAISRTSTGENR